MNKEIKTSFVICIDNKEYPASLEQFKVYQQLPDAKALAMEYVRVIDESGEGYLYPQDYFVALHVPKIVEDAMISKQ